MNSFQQLSLESILSLDESLSDTIETFNMMVGPIEAMRYHVWFNQEIRLL